MKNLDSTDKPPSDHDADVVSEDRLIRLSKQVAEEIIAVQTRLIALERREDTPARQHETELLWRQIKTLEAKKSEYEGEIARLQERIRACRDAGDRKAPDQAGLYPQPGPAKRQRAVCWTPSGAKAPSVPWPRPRSCRSGPRPCAACPTASCARRFSARLNAASGAMSFQQIFLKSRKNVGNSTD